MNSTQQLLTSAIFHSLWQGVVLAALLWLTLHLLRNHSASARYGASVIAMGLFALLPIVTVVVLQSRLTLPNGAAHFADNAWQVFAGSFISLGRAQPLATGWFERWALPLWAAGTILFSLRFAIGFVGVAQMRRGVVPADSALLALVRRVEQRLGARRRIRVVASRATDVPSVIGWLKPVLLLPVAALVMLTSEQLEAIIAHEIAHIRRHDYLVNLIQTGIETVLFYHPAVWWISARIRHERELCCDDAVVNSGSMPLTYVRALMALEGLRLAAPSLSLASTDGQLTQRILRLLQQSPSRGNSFMRLPTFLALCLTLACAGANVSAPAESAKNTERLVDLRPVWSPDGEVVVFEAYTPSGANFDDTSLVLELDSASRKADVVEARLQRNDATRIKLGKPNPAEGSADEYIADLVDSHATKWVTIRRSSIAGLRIIAIQIAGLTPDQHRRLQLPVGIGDHFDADSPSQLEQAVAKLSDQLEVQVSPVGNGDAVIRIGMRGARGPKAH